MINKDCQLIWEAYNSSISPSKFKKGDWVIIPMSDLNSDPIITQVDQVSIPIYNRTTGKYTYCYTMTCDNDKEIPLDYYENEIEEYFPEIHDNKDKGAIKQILDI